MVSNGTYMMILAIFLVVIVIFLLAVFFFLRKSVANAKRDHPNHHVVDSKDHVENTCPDGFVKGASHTSTSHNLDSITKISFLTHVENEQNRRGKSGGKASDVGNQNQHQEPVNLSAQDSLLKGNNCLNCSLIEMGSSCSYSDGSCPQCGRIPS